jgi:segregation and condensation protein B
LTKDNLHRIIEALLFASDVPLTMDKLKDALGGENAKKVRNALNRLEKFYDSSGSAVKLTELAGGFQLISREEYAPFVQQLYRGRSSPRLTQRALETLAIIAYKQPITKQEMEAIRGVNVDGVVKTLLERNLIKIEGRQKAPGNPLLYGTSKFFLQYFGLKSLADLPKLKEIDELLKDDEKFLESLDQVSLQQLAPEALGITTPEELNRDQTELNMPDQNSQNDRAEEKKQDDAAE